MTIAGIDVSDHQAKNEQDKVVPDLLNWQAVKSCGISFAFVKATEGATFVAKSFDDFWPRMKEVGIFRGAYHFYRPGRTAIAQAENFLKELQKVKLEENDLPPVLDIEVRDGVSASDIKQGMMQWLKAVEDETKRKPLIYTSNGFWDQLGRAGEFAEYPLWIAHYDKPKPRIPGNWKSCTFWQYSQSGGVKGVKGNVDLNWFNGSLDGLKAFAKGDVSGVRSDSLFDNLINEGDTGSDVEKIQQLLENKGFDVGQIDGHFGTLTKAAVMRFQKANNLPVNGIVDPAMLEKLK